MLLERSGFIFAITTNKVREIMAFDQSLITDGGESIFWQSQVIPLIELEKGINFHRPHRTMGLTKEPTIDKPTVLVVGDQDVSMGFKIDRYWGEQEVTSRAIDSVTPMTPGINNSIILGDGRVVPLIDPIELVGWMSAKGKLLKDNTIDLNSAIPTKSQERHRILVVDDSINVRRYLAAMLERAGYEVEQAKDGQEAVDKLHGGLVVQAVICDLEMPRLDGYGVIESLRSHQHPLSINTLEDLPILMLTSRSSDKHRKLAMNLGASAYFSKPYEEGDLLKTLSSLIGKRVDQPLTTGYSK
jgi:chemosensory pili system protein ChpA (sensor histidine kinase/response regulator)